MEKFVSEIDGFIERISSVTRPYMEGSKDRQFVRDTYVKWRQLQNLVELSEVPDSQQEKMRAMMENAFEESFKERPRRDKISDSLKEFSRIFKKEVITERKIRGDPIELEWEDPVSHFETYGITKEFEEQVREFLEQKLQEEFGKAWLERGVPPGPREDWADRKKEDEKEAKRTSEDIDYASFGHYFEVIKYNWSEVFKEVFDDKEKTKIRFNDIQNLIRNPSAHIRKIDPDEVGHAKYTKRWIENKIGEEDV